VGTPSYIRLALETNTCFSSYLVTIFTNQAGLNLHPDTEQKSKGPNTSRAARHRLSAFKQKCGAVLANLDIPVTIYAATDKDVFRKPQTGMWTELMRDYKLLPDSVDQEGSIFVGDAGGRIASIRAGRAVPKDFSCSDRNFASNIGIRYLTPEEFFLGESPRDFVRDFDLGQYAYSNETDTDDATGIFHKTSELDVVLFCGPPGAGKSTFYWDFLKPLGYERVNQDILKT
jgi:bifunctional polynucleotide phosphatase/kinase